MHGIYGGLPSWRNPAKHPTSPHGSMAAGDCSDAAVQGLCAGRGMVEARGRSCWGTAGAHRSKQRSYVRLRRNTGPKATRHPAWECWRTGKLQSTESPWCVLRPDFTFDISHTNKMLRAFCSAFCRKRPVYTRHLAKRFACKTFGPNVLHFPNEMQCKTFGAK